MKIKYLLRGIGIGAILATAIMYFIYGKSDKALSDDEIRAKARELGMMTVNEFQDKELNSLKDKLPELSEIKVDEKTETDGGKDKASDTSKNTPSEKGGKAGKSEKNGDNAGKTTDSEENKAGNSKSGNAGTKPTGADGTKDGSTKADKTKADKTKTTDAGNGGSKDRKEETGKITFSITTGMSSEKVAASLKSLGLVDNGAEFNKYLVNNGYADKIKVGTFELRIGQSYAEIAAELTK